MASDEHKKLAQYLKDVHNNLRKCTAKLGATDAWINHCKSKDTLITYAKCMEKLATIYWEDSCGNERSLASSRIDWSVNLTQDYFINKTYMKYSEKDYEIGKKLNIFLECKESFSEPLKLLDVGSCYNPFKKFHFYTVLAIDLCPANKDVMQCDFLNIQIGEETKVEDNSVRRLKEESFDLVTFCFLLEYIPSSDLRIKACKNAYRLLKPGGLLIIITPDSKHVGANCKLMKNWQYTLACLGFTRIKYEKLRHMHCMGFRKALHKDVAKRWASIHKHNDMEFSINIPQDFSPPEVEHNKQACAEVSLSLDDFKELPFPDL